MKYTVYLVLKINKANPQGLLPIYIKITINRKESYISTGHYIHEKYWDEKSKNVKSSHPDAGTINADINNRKSLILRKIAEHQLDGKALVADQIKRMFVTNRDLHNIFEFVDQFIDEVKNKRSPATIENYRKHALKLEQFHKSRSLSFEEITPAFLTRYENWLWETVKGNYIHGLFKTLRTFFNAARERKIITCYPFDEYDNPVYEAPTKAYLSLPELKAWEKHISELKDPVLRQTAIYFLLGCYTGLRISDWLRFNLSDNIESDRVKLRATKNGEWISMPVSGPLARILVLIEETPLTIEEPTINEKLKVIASNLKIKKHVTTHTGRHTFAITICANRGISCETTATLMGITVKTCLENYYKVTDFKIKQETLRAWEGLI
jgi:site-specific recombinase XerD